MRWQARRVSVRHFLAKGVWPMPTDAVRSLSTLHHPRNVGAAVRRRPACLLGVGDPADNLLGHGPRLGTPLGGPGSAGHLARYRRGRPRRKLLGAGVPGLELVGGTTG